MDLYVLGSPAPPSLANTHFSYASAPSDIERPLLCAYEHASHTWRASSNIRVPSTTHQNMPCHTTFAFWTTNDFGRLLGQTLVSAACATTVRPHVHIAGGGRVVGSLAVAYCQIICSTHRHVGLPLCSLYVSLLIYATHAFPQGVASFIHSMRHMALHKAACGASINPICCRLATTPRQTILMLAACCRHHPPQDIR